MKNISLACVIVFLLLMQVSAQTENGNDLYIPPTDSLVKQNLENWQDMKFGLLMHWGLYSQLGVVESWGLCSEDQDFQDRNGMDYIDYKNHYFGQIKKFNPQQFNPDAWAEAAQKAGMKYVVFTTKHHDGFCMFDTKQTDFKITSGESPFSSNPKANVAKYVFEAFRNKGFMVGAYFSKPDWHCPAYWTPLLATPDRNCNYDTRKYPGRWKEFQNYTYNQIEELTTAYGKLDILWLDGGWVRPDSTINDEVRSWGYNIPKYEQDIDMPRIASMARKNQPGILIVDRTVHGPFENYRTPEQSIPDSILPYPFETCMTMTDNWGFVPNARFKSAETIIRSMVDVVSKGGNFLLNVGPTPQGTFEEKAISTLNEIGKWMSVNGEAIYGSRSWKQFKDGDAVRFTQSEDGKYLYVFALQWPGKSLSLSCITEKKNYKVLMLGSNEKIKTSFGPDGFTLRMPDSMKDAANRPTAYISVFRITLK
ncbi:MAG TPA: alpha-L-fucosidase [Bacteroidales bacterium]|nr:alpha-L-fucosidase [Bacteroidales bacterium]